MKGIPYASAVASKPNVCNGCDPTWSRICKRGHKPLHGQSRKNALGNGKAHSVIPMWYSWNVAYLRTGEFQNSGKIHRVWLRWKHFVHNPSLNSQLLHLLVKLLNIMSHYLRPIVSCVSLSKTIIKSIYLFFCLFSSLSKIVVCLCEENA